MFSEMLKMLFSFVNNKPSLVKDKKSQVLGGIFGVCVGDALGVPVEFKTRKELKHSPVKDMGKGGIHWQPSGTWSDDTSMTLCLIDSLINGYDLDNIGKTFCDWYYKGLWTANGVVFDIGATTRIALKKINTGTSPKISGLDDKNTCGNGSLMRILPLAYFLEDYKSDRFEIIEEVSAITHSHIRCKIACSIYVEFAINLLKGYSPLKAYEVMKPVIMNYYKKYINELTYFNKILDNSIYTFRKKDINSSGYVVDTLEASLWSFLKSNSFKDAVLTAINLGEDTDTTGAVTGGLAGIYYGFEGIPSKWKNQIARANDIYDLTIRFYKSLYC